MTGMYVYRRSIVSILILFLLSLIFGFYTCTDMFRSDIVPPAAFIVSPLDGAYGLQGTVPIQIKLYDNSAIEYVDFYIDNVKIARLKRKPFTYYWNTNFWNSTIDHRIYIEAFDEYGNSAFSDVIEVSVALGALTGPVNTYPGNDALISSENLTLHWKGQKNASLYHIEISTAPDMSEPVITEQTADTSYQLTLERNQYYFRVRAEISIDDTTQYFTAYSEVHRFFIGERIFIQHLEGEASEWGEYIFQNPDSSYRIVATKRIYLSGGTRYRLLIKDLDILGNLRRQDEYYFFQKPYAAAQIDNNIVLASYNLFNKAIWMSIDTSGTILWQNVLEEDSRAKALTTGSSGDIYTIAEKLTSGDSLSVNLIQMGTDGTIFYDRQLFMYPRGQFDTHWDIVENSSGNFFLAGDRGLIMHLYEVTAGGDIIQQHTYDESSKYQLVSLENSDYGEILIIANQLFGNVGSYNDQLYNVDNSDGVILHVDASGNLVGRDLFDGSGLEMIVSVKKTSDGGFILSGSTDSRRFGLNDIWVSRLNGDFSEQWSCYYGKTMNNFGAGICETFDGGYIFTGTITSYTSGVNADIICVKTDENGRTIRNWFLE